MKLNFPNLAATLFLLATASSSASEAEKPTRETTVTIQRAVPIENYWDANAWDPLGGSLFWHATRDNRETNRAGAHEGRNTRYRDSRRHANSRKSATR